MTKCSKCGSELKEGAKFCTRCGTKITLLSPESAARIDILKKRIEKDSLNAKLYAELGDTYQQNDLLQEALIEYQKAVNIDSSNYDAHLKSGDIYFKLKQLEKAENSYQKALDLNSSSPQAKLGLFKTYYLQSKLEQAMALGEQIIQSDPNNLEIHKTLKEIYLRKEMNERVSKELETICLLAPKDKQSLKELAGFYAESGENEKELKCYQRALELDPEDIETRFSIGEWFLAKGDYQKTVEHLKGIAQKLPSQLELYAHLYLALAYINLQQLDSSIEEITAIEEITSVSLVNYENLKARDRKLLGEAYYRIARAVMQNKNFSTAFDYLEKSLKCEPHNREYQKQLETARAEVAGSKRKAKRRSLTVGIAISLAAAIIIAGWYLSHGKIQIKITPADSVRVYVDGKRVVVPRSEKRLEGVADKEPELITTPSLFFGVHKISVEKDGYEKWERDVKVGWGKIVAIKPTLLPTYGSLKINSQPSGAEVYLDEKFLGKTPLVIDTILATGHVLALKREGYSIHKRNITISTENAVQLDIPLRRPLSRAFKDIEVTLSDAPGSYFQWEPNDTRSQFRVSKYNLLDGNIESYVTVQVGTDVGPSNADRLASLHWIVLSFPNERYVTKIGLVTCNHGIAETAKFQLKEIDIVFSDGTTRSMTLIRSVLDMQYCSVEPPKRTKCVVIKPSKLQLGTGWFYYFGIAEIQIQGYDVP